jgi:hypothetical protein
VERILLGQIAFSWIWVRMNVAWTCAQSVRPKGFAAATVNSSAWLVLGVPNWRPPECLQLSSGRCRQLLAANAALHGGSTQSSHTDTRASTLACKWPPHCAGSNEHQMAKEHGGVVLASRSMPLQAA